MKRKELYNHVIVTKEVLYGLPQKMNSISPRTPTTVLGFTPQFASPRGDFLLVVSLFSSVRVCFNSSLLSRVCSCCSSVDEKAEAGRDGD